jgi:hypothetical protein
MATKRQEATSGRCKAKSETGRTLRRSSGQGEFCSLHSNPRCAAELGRKGGTGNRHIFENDGREVAAPQTASV